MVTDIVGIGKAAEPLVQGFRGLLSLFFKPAAVETGLWLGDRVRIVRERNLENVLSKAKKKLDAAGIEINPIATKIFLPLVEAASLEDEEEMIERWANLLAAAASGKSVLPSYIQILSQLSPDEARILDLVQELQRDIRENKNSGSPIFAANIKDVQQTLKLPGDTFRRGSVNLDRLELLKRRFPIPSIIFGGIPPAKHESDLVGTTEFADDILGMCNRPPGRAVA